MKYLTLTIVLGSNHCARVYALQGMIIKQPPANYLWSSVGGLADLLVSGLGVFLEQMLLCNSISHVVSSVYFLYGFMWTSTIHLLWQLMVFT